MITGVTSVSQAIIQDIDEIDQLLDATKKKESKNTTKQLDSLLIDYILAKMKGDTSGAQSISNQISSLLKKYGDDMQKANSLVDKLKAVANDPSQQTPSELSYLQDLIASLKQDASTGEMDGF